MKEFITGIHVITFDSYSTVQLLILAVYTKCRLYYHRLHNVIEHTHFRPYANYCIELLSFGFVWFIKDKDTKM